jgi:hypothetical protein
MSYFVEGLSDHLEPQTQVRRIGEYKTLAEAIAIAHRTIDDFLRKAHTAGQDPRALFGLYQTRGEHPYIFRNDEQTFNVPGFNHLHYAMTRAGEICRGKQ